MSGTEPGLSGTDSELGLSGPELGLGLKRTGRSAAWRWAGPIDPIGWADSDSESAWQSRR